MCSQPQQLLQVLQQTLPPQVFQLLLQRLPIVSQVSTLSCTMGHSIFCLYPPYGRHQCLKKNSMELPMDDTHTENKNPWKNLWMTSMMFSVFHGKTYG